MTRDEEAIGMRLEGHSYRAIAEKLGYESQQAAYDAVNANLSIERAFGRQLDSLRIAREAFEHGE